MLIVPRNLKLGPLEVPKGLLLVLGLSLALNVCGIWWGLFEGIPHSWEVDEVRPFWVVNGISDKFSGGWYTKYPPLHFYVLAVLYSPVLLLHATGAIDLWQSEGVVALSLMSRLLSTVMSVAILALIFAVASELGLGKRAGVLGSLIAALTLPMVYYSKTSNLDVPYAFWFSVSLLFLVRSFNRQRVRDHVSFAASAVLAVCTKDQAYGLYVLTVPVLWLSVLRTSNPGRWKWFGFLLDKRIAIPSLVAILLFVVIHNLAFNASGFVEHVRFITGPGSDPYRVFEGTILGHARAVMQAVRHVVFAFGLPMFIVCVLGIAGAMRRPAKCVVLLSLLVPVASYYLTFIAVIGYQADRFMLPICIVLALFGGKWLADHLEPGLPRRGLRSLGFAALIGYSLMYAFSVNSLILADSRYEVQEWMRAHLDSDVSVMGVGQRAYLPVLRGWRTSEYIPLQELSIQLLSERNPDVLVTTSADGPDRLLPGTEGELFFRRLYGRELDYELVYERQGRPLVNLLNFKRVSTNLDQVNPRIRVFVKHRSSMSRPDGPAR